MSKGAGLLGHLRGSVFTKLVVTMLAMTVSLLGIVVVFFLLYLGPVLNGSIDGVVHEYMHTVAAARPTYERAREMANRSGVQTRYEGPNGTWSTADDVPSAADVKHRGHGPINRRHYFVMPVPDGGSYVFAWQIPDRMYTAHVVVPLVVLFAVAAVVFAAHGVLKRLLLPVRLLGDGVARLSDGQLDVVVPTRSADEFGKLTDAFNRMVGRIKDMIRTREQLLVDVSHELRSPLSRLKVAVQFVGEPDIKARMSTDLATLDVMIGELLELERLRDGAGIKTTRQNLVTLLDEVVEGFHDRPPGVHFERPRREILVDGDAERLRTVFRNLLENAVKYSLPESRPVELFATQDTDRVIVRVIDDGPGIPEDDKTNLFEPFFRVDRSRSKKTGGYGLGLSIARRIVEAHGGTIAVENNAVRGALFIVTLPKAA
jgi:signal transduction histidine kinase